MGGLRNEKRRLRFTRSRGQAVALRLWVPYEVRQTFWYTLLLKRYLSTLRLRFRRVHENLFTKFNPRKREVISQHI